MENQKICLYCGKTLQRKNWVGLRNYKESKKRFQARKFCDNECRSKQLSIDGKGDKNYFYGKHLVPHNYKEKIRWLVKQDTGYIRVIYKNNDGSKYFKYLHREIMENLLKRQLSTEDVVHHIDGDRSNNDEHNLLVCSRSEHRHYHSKANNH
jgi:hypothetical protein